MKKFIISVLGLALGTAGFAIGQSAAPGEGTTMGRGKGGAPYAWNDKNKDGICDVTNQPAGRRAMGMRGKGRGRAGMQGAGRGMAGNMSGGQGRGMGRRMGNWSNQAASQAPQAK